MYEKSVTLKDVAARSAYSLRTVKKVMSGDKTVRPETRENVLQVAKELGYKKNMVASILATNRIRNIAIILGDYRYFFPEAKASFRKCHKSWISMKVGIEFLLPKSRTLESSKDLLRSLLHDEKFDAVIMHASSMTELNPEINALMEKGKMVCTFGADAPASKRLFYVGPRAYESGRIAAQAMANYTGGTGKIYIMKQSLVEMQTQERVRGFYDYMSEKYPDIRIEQILISGGVEDYHKKTAELMKLKDVAGVVGTDADCYIIGSEARKAGRKDVVSLGFDLSVETAELMREDYFTLILDQNPEQQAMIALDSICRHLLYNTKMENIFTDVAIVTSEILRYKEKTEY